MTTKKARTHKAAKTEATEAGPTETALTAERLPTEVAEVTESPPPPAPEPLPTVTSMPVPVEAARAAQAEEPPPPGEAASLPTAPTSKLSALEAALRGLGESGQAINCRELIAAMAAKGYWNSPKGRTPMLPCTPPFCVRCKSRETRRGWSRPYVASSCSKARRSVR
jgi:hypothetical protein